MDKQAGESALRDRRLTNRANGAVLPTPRTAGMRHQCRDGGRRRRDRRLRRTVRAKHPLNGQRGGCHGRQDHPEGVPPPVQGAVPVGPSPVGRASQPGRRWQRRRLRDVPPLRQGADAVRSAGGAVLGLVRRVIWRSRGPDGHLLPAAALGPAAVSAVAASASGHLQQHHGHDDHRCRAARARVGAAAQVPSDPVRRSGRLVRRT